MVSTALDKPSSLNKYNTKAIIRFKEFFRQSAREELFITFRKQNVTL